MSADLLNFKSCFGDPGITVVYLDSQGSEIPITNEREFQEAIRVSKLSKSRLKLILYYNKSKENQFESSAAVPWDVPFEPVKPGTVQQDSALKEKCQCNRDVPPDWFINYMEKFKKDFMHELKSSLCDSIQSIVAKEKKLSNLKRVTTDLSCVKIETASAPITIQSKKKKKRAEKDLGELLDQRGIKAAKKNEKLHQTKFERLEKLDNKTRVLLEEKRRLLEKKRHSKHRFDKNHGIMSEIEKLKRSASFRKNEVCLFLPPNAEFAVTINFTNDGMLRWEAPWLECFDVNGLYPKEVKICLPRLRPLESGFTTLRGKVSECEGLHHFKCRLFDGLRKIGTEFTCWAKVEVNETVKKVPNAMVSCKESHDRKREDSVGILIDFEKDELAATQKKIEENICEIEKRLQDINLLKPPTSSEDNVKNNAADLEMSEEFQNSGHNSSQNIEEKEVNWKEKLEQEGVYFGVDCLRLTTPNNQKKQDENGRVENFEKLQKNEELESSSDSELSVIFLSEEDENFIIIPLLSKSPSPAESVHEDKKFVKTPLEGIADAKSLKQKPSQSFKTDILENNDEILNISERRQRLPGPLRNRRPPLGEVSKSKPKKIKPSSTEYHYMTANLTEPAYTLISERFSEERPSKFTFTGDKNEKKSFPEGVFLGRPSKRIPAQDNKEKISDPEREFFDRHSEPTPTKKKKENSQKKDDFKDCNVPTKDASGKVIYVVNSNGLCFPLGDVMKEWDQSKESDFYHGTERRSYPENDIFDGTMISDLMTTGASSVALLAFKTVRSVINNINSAFMSEWKKKTGKPAHQNRKILNINAMSTLLKMGFTDVEMNEQLLLIHQNDITKVVEDLLKLK